MTKTKKGLALTLGIALATTAGAAAVVFARPNAPMEAAPVCGGPGMGHGGGHREGHGEGHGNEHGGGHGNEHGEGRGNEHGGGHGADMMGIHFLFANRDGITRTVTEIPRGVRTLTEANDPAVTAQLQEHVQAMYDRLKDGRPIHARDPLFAALFRNADKIDVRIEKTEKGLRVTETSADPDVVKLIRRHAEVVSLFLANGMPEMMKNHQ